MYYLNLVFDLASALLGLDWLTVLTTCDLYVGKALASIKPSPVSWVLNPQCIVNMLPADLYASHKSDECKCPPLNQKYSFWSTPPTFLPLLLRQLYNGQLMWEAEAAWHGHVPHVLWVNRFEMWPLIILSLHLIPPVIPCHAVPHLHLSFSSFFSSLNLSILWIFCFPLTFQHHVHLAARPASLTFTLPCYRV